MARNPLITDEIEDQNTAALKRRMTSRTGAGDYDFVPKRRPTGSLPVVEEIKQYTLPLLIKSALACYQDGYRAAFAINVESIGLDDDISVQDYCEQNNLALPQNIHYYSDGSMPAVYWLATALPHLALPDIVEVHVTEGIDGTHGIRLTLPDV